MHHVSSVVRTRKDVSVQVDQHVLFCFSPGNKTIVSDAKSITQCRSHDEAHISIEREWAVTSKGKPFCFQVMAVKI